MFVKPAENPDAPGECLIVRDPMDPRRVLPAEGAEVPETQYWYARLRDGDIELADAPDPELPEATAKPAREA
jgi:hypothetical protein